MTRTVAIMSRHAVGNYGSLLQAYALQRAITVIGFDPFYVDYAHRADQAWQSSWATLCDSERWNRNVLTRAAFLAIRVPASAYRDHRFASWMPSLLKLSAQRYRDDRSLQQGYPVADVYCTGSDQVWNATGKRAIDENYALTFLAPEVPRIAYGASFGRDRLSPDEKERLRTGLGRYHAISVREESGIGILGDMGILSGKRVLDPTMLLTVDDWSALVTSRTPQDRYLLVYQLHWDKDSDDYARRLAAVHGLDLIRISTSAHDKFRASGKVLLLPQVGDFLRLFLNAEFVLTDSFHGTVFSIVFNRSFVAMLPPRYSERNLSLLAMTGLTDRVIRDFSDEYFANRRIDFDPVNAILERERTNSWDFLKQALNEVSPPTP